MSTPASSRKPVPMLDLKRQYATIRHDVLQAIEKVCESQSLILGEEVAAFEREAAAFTGAAECVACASGTDALWLCLEASGVQPGDSFITAAFTFFASASSIVRCGGRPVFADIDPATFNLSPRATAEVIERQRFASLKGVMPIHLYGQCAEMDAFSRLAGEHHLSIVEDAAQAFGATWEGRPAGSLGRAAAFSFYPTKNLSAFGDAGCATTGDAELAGHIRRLRNHGSARRYYHEEIGWNSRMDAIQGAVLRIKLRHIKSWNDSRHRIADRYDELLQRAGLTGKRGASVTVSKSAPIQLPATDERAHHIFHQYVVRAHRRDELREFLSERQIGSEVYYPVPLHLQQAFAYLGYKAGDLPETERACREVLALPIFPELSDEEQQTVVGAISEFYG